MHEIENPHLPLVHPLYENLHPGCEINVHATVHTSDGHQFAVELLSGPHIVLHVNFRFSHNVIVLNACEHGKWGHELRYENTLNDGDHFHLHIHVHDSHYTIELNGNTIGKFDHRFPYESVQALGIHGGLHVKKVSFKGFSFSKDWHHEHHQHDWGHDGYIGYGTDAYSPPQFREGHHHASYWN